MQGFIICHAWNHWNDENSKLDELDVIGNTVGDDDNCEDDNSNKLDGLDDVHCYGFNNVVFDTASRWFMDIRFKWISMKII